MACSIKSAHDIAHMRVAGRLAAEVLDFIAPYVRPGVTTEELDRLCHDYIVDVQRAIPAPLNYSPPGHPPYPKSICTSVNEVVCHGIPGSLVLKDGDLINIDITVIKDGYHGDTSRMFHVGQVSPEAARLSAIAFACMWQGISEVRPGATLGDIGFATQQFAESAGCSVVREIWGHGIGKGFHEEPFVRHFGQRGAGESIVEGMIFTIEPILNLGGREIEKMDDGWTLRTRDRRLSAQWEHTVLVTDTGYEVLTVSAGMPPPPPGVPLCTPSRYLALPVAG